MYTQFNSVLPSFTLCYLVFHRGEGASFRLMYGDALEIRQRILKKDGNENRRSPFPFYLVFFYLVFFFNRALIIRQGKTMTYLVVPSFFGFFFFFGVPGCWPRVVT